MPSTINGVGTRYRNETNHRWRPGRCGHCGFQGNLGSYDAEEWFVVLYIPVLKVKTLRVVNYCGKCTRHSAIKRDDWDRMRTESVSAALAKYRENAKDGANAVALLDSADYFDDTETYSSAFAEIKTALADDPDVLAYLARMALRTGDSAEAARTYARIVEIDAYNFDAHSMLMLLAVDEKDLPTVEKHAQVIVDNAAATFAPRLIGAVQLCQELGDHRKALDMLDRTESLSPEMAQEKDFQRLRSLSKSHEATGKAVKATTFEFGRAERERKRRNGAIAAAVVVAGVGVLYVAYCAILGHREPLWLVNGTRDDYSVKIDGKEFMIPRGTHVPARVGLGTHVLEPVDGSLQFPRTEFQMKKSLLLRPFSETSFASNPDAAGVLAVVTFFYGSSSQETSPPAFRPRKGEPFMEFPHIEHPFEDPPDKVSASRGERPTRTVLTAGTLEWALVVAPGKLGDAVVLQAARRRMEVDEDPSLVAFDILLSPDILAKLLEDKAPAGFADAQERGAYYGAMAAAGKLDEAVAALDAALAEKPGDSALLSARAFVETDPDKALELLERAADAEDVSDETKGEYGAALIRRGRVQEGFDIIDGLASLPETCSGEYYHELIERGEFEKLQSVVEGHEAGFAGDLEAMLEASLGDGGKGKIDLARLPTSEERKQTVESYVRANTQYAAGDLARAAESFEKVSWGRFAAAIIRGKNGTALEARNYSLGGVGFDDLLLLLDAEHRRDTLGALEELPRAMQYLRSTARGGPVLADMIEGKIEADADKAIALDMRSRVKSLGLLVLAGRKPELRSALYPVIEKLNDGHVFPASHVRKYMEDQPEPLPGIKLP